MSTSVKSKIVKRCPTCGRSIKSVLDYPRVRILSFERLPVPEHSYSAHAINGPSEMEIKRASKLWLDRVDFHEGDPLSNAGAVKKEKKRIHLLDRYTGVADAGAAFKKFKSSGKKRMEYKNLLFERKRDAFRRAEMFTVQRDMMPLTSKIIPDRWLDEYCNRLKRLVGRVVRTEVLSAEWKGRGSIDKDRSLRYKQGAIGIDLWPVPRERVSGTCEVKIAVTFCTGGSISIIEPLFYVALMKLQGMLIKWN